MWWIGAAVVLTGEAVMREQPLPGAVLTRVAESHLRVGTFEFAAATGKPELLKALADYTLQRHFPECMESHNPYLAMLQAVMERQASLVSQWMLVGFIHGVMNTDNMAIGGQTIDYGPCAFMDEFSVHTVFSSIDHQGRYAYGNQPKIAQWNLARFAETLLPLIDDDSARAIDRATGALRENAELLIRATLGFFFVALWTTGGIILTPELTTTSQLIPWLQLSFAAGLLWRRTLPYTAAGIVAMFATAVTQYGAFHLADYPIFLGIAAYLVLTAMGRDLFGLRPVRTLSGAPPKAASAAAPADRIPAPA